MQNKFKNNPLELQGNFSIGGFRVSVIGGLDSSDPPQPEAFDKVLRIVRERSQSENTPLVSVASDPEGFLSTSFLETGIKYSQSVCRIARYFSRPDFIAFIDKIKQAIVTHTNVSSNFDTVEEVIEVFSIPPEIAAEIFDIPLYQAAPISQNPLDDLRKITENQLAKINPIPIGTGFLVGGSHLLTNHHVIDSKEIAAQCVAQFNYVENAQGYIQKLIDYEFDPILFVTEPGLDYTLVQLKSGMFTRQAGYEFGWVQLIEDEESVKPGLDWVEFKFMETRDKALKASQEAIEQLRKKGYTVVVEAEAIVIWHPEGKYNQDEIKAIGVQMGYKEFSDVPKLVSSSDHIKSKQGDAVIIVQHPKGKQKQIVLSNNEIIKNGLYQGVLRYKAESDYGSSGSPVFNTHWKLVALHHAAVPRPPESSISSEQQQTKINYKPIAQQGIRICRIIEDIRRKSVTNSKLRSFVQDFVIASEHINYPPLPAVARLNGGVSGQKNGYFNCGNDESLTVSEAITCEAWVAKRDDENGFIFRRSEEKNEYALWCFNGNIRAQIRSEKKEYIVDTKKPAPQDGLWHHVAFTWSKSQEIQIYIDGEKQETKTHSKDDGTPLETPIGKINRPLCIGGESEQACLGGDIAEARLWKTVRSQAQIKETMYLRLTGDYSKEELIGYWQFEKDKASQTYVYNLACPDGGAKVPHIEPFTSSTQKIQPRFGLELNGKTDYIDCGSVAIDKAITFEAWVKPIKPEDKDENRRFIAAQGGVWGGLGYSLWWLSNNNKIRVEFQGEHNISFDGSIQDYDWHHIAFTWSSDLPNICIYIDGTRYQDEKTFAGLIGSSGMNFCIGRNKAITFYYFKGSIAEARLWKVARSEEQINDAMKRPLEPPESEDSDLVGYWRLDEQTGNEAANRAGKGQPGSVYGGTWIYPQSVVELNQRTYGVALGDVKWLKASECSVSLPLPCGLKFNDKDNQVNCGQDPSLNVTDDITVEAWVKHQFGNRLIVSRGCYVDDGYSLCWHDSKIRVMLKSANQEAIVDTKENAPIDQVWHHIAFTWDTTSQEIFIYVDGRQQDCVVIEGQTKSIAYAGQTKSTALFTGSLTDLNGTKKSSKLYGIRATALKAIE